MLNFFFFLKRRSVMFFTHLHYILVHILVIFSFIWCLNAPVYLKTLSHPWLYFLDFLFFTWISRNAPAYCFGISQAQSLETMSDDIIIAIYIQQISNTCTGLGNGACIWYTDISALYPFVVSYVDFYKPMLVISQFPLKKRPWESKCN